ncbi:MAG: N-acylglucosamine 2-epimerase, partial [Spirochaetales bacterium]|nr:N-acylglucosamine 2-epimerase [Spirochaetales bacterium]
MLNNQEERTDLYSLYRETLLEDVVPFWLKHSLDTEYGGYLFCLEQDGSVADTDKPMWIHGRFVWLLSTLYADVEQKAEWLDAARIGIEFMEQYGTDSRDGRRYYTLTREGKPLRKRRYIFTEAFAVIAYAAYGRATGEKKWIDKAADLFKLIPKLLATPGLLEPKSDPETRSGKSLAVPMILVNTA